MTKGIFKLACAFGAMAFPAYGGWLWSNTTNLEAGVVVLGLGTAFGAACLEGYAAISRAEG